MNFCIIDAQTYNQGKIGAIVEIVINCNENSLNNIEKSDLCAFAKEILFHIATTAPLYMSIADVPNNIIQSIKDKISEDLKNNYFLCNNHTERAKIHIQKQINKGVEHLLNNFYKETCLLTQPFIKDKNKTIQSLIEEKSMSIGKVVRVKRFERYDIDKEYSEKKQYAFNIPLEQGIPLEILKEKCPKCGNSLVYVTYGSSYEIICERQGCYKQTCKGI